MADKTSTKTLSAGLSTRPHHRTAIGQAQREKTRAHIIDSAIPVFAELGPDVPVIDDFVKAAGVSRGTFYNYFQTTRELLDACIDAMSNEVIETIIPAVRDLSDPVHRLATAARLYYRKATHDPLFRAFLGSVSGIGAVAMEHARGDLEEAIAQGQVEVRDIELAQAIAVGVMVFALKSRLAPSGDDDQGAEVVRAILRGLGASAQHIDDALARELPAVDASRPAVATAG